MGITTLAQKDGGARLALILAAERMIAEHGAMGVSLRQILEAADVRNMSAVQYHFGSREELIAAVYRLRMGPINERRLAMLAELSARGAMADQRALIGALVQPLAAETLTSEQPGFYCRFLLRRMYDDSGDANLAASPELVTGWRAVEDALRRTLRHLPLAIVEMRLIMCRDHIVATLAGFERTLSSARLTAPTAERPAAHGLAVETLIDAVLAQLTGAVSPAALDCLAD